MDITITTELYEQLKLDSAKLASLEAAGVDNWEWYSDAMASFYEEDN